MSGALAACGGSGSSGATPGGAQGAGALNISPQNSTLLVGVDRISVAILDADQHPVLDAAASVDIVGPTDQRGNGGQRLSTRPLQFIGAAYGNIPVYLGVARFPQTGTFTMVVHATMRDGRSDRGSAIVTVTTKSAELPVGFNVSAVQSLRQRTAADVSGDLSQIDSGVPPDSFHDATIADGLARHQAMILYFGEPGRCVSRTCGPTVQLLQQLAPQYPGRLLIEHIEVHDPAPGEAFNPVYVGFGLTSEPWVYFVNAQGVVSDRFEGPVSIEQLRDAAEGTLAGRVPAVDVSA